MQRWRSLIERRRSHADAPVPGNIGATWDVPGRGLGRPAGRPPRGSRRGRRAGVTVTPAGPLPSGTQTITVTGSGFDAVGNEANGVYVAFGPVTPAPNYYMDPSVYAVVKWVYPAGVESPRHGPDGCRRLVFHDARCALQLHHAHGPGGLLGGHLCGHHLRRSRVRGPNPGHVHAGDVRTGHRQRIRRRSDERGTGRLGTGCVDGRAGGVGSTCRIRGSGLRLRGRREPARRPDSTVPGAGRRPRAPTATEMRRPRRSGVFCTVPANRTLRTGRLPRYKGIYHAGCTGYPNPTYP